GVFFLWLVNATRWPPDGIGGREKRRPPHGPAALANPQPAPISLRSPSTGNREPLQMAPLFDPTTLGDLPLKNRIVMAPLTRCRADAGGVPSELMAEYYRQRASAGLILSAATAVTPMGVGDPHTPGIWSAEQMTGWSKAAARSPRPCTPPAARSSCSWGTSVPSPTPCTWTASCPWRPAPSSPLAT